ncbi:hypothetical protein Curi_c03570 [Gottschalkia acidurici 9a]|uniref:Nicotianamine synthase protein n=1 Tax=Gottschalkia acidurici (strain ATCC 7906 / DSM 604 / BCRC 14475 / CIP 104303 / KCTC 5404 / NCIMB 10678 / 9a) TaxID=1128398 RepID=K0AXE5_GOTA9|nr:class I SAM-dependent methyltransferase [Gottschalkia acidurici]AFS77432.1 hypothetical protein Curi_c03570 [Gottschalkia acidurici 9a]
MSIIPRFTKSLERITSFFPRLVYFYSLYYKDIVEKEVELGQLTEEDKVLCIGGGPFPCTALEIAYQTGAKVCVVDCDPVAVSCAQRVIDKLNMSERVRVFISRGEDIDPSKYSVIHMALQVFPKDKILKNILKRCSSETRVLVRSPKEHLKSLYFKEFEITDNQYQNQSIDQDNCTMNATLLFRKIKE